MRDIVNYFKDVFKTLFYMYSLFLILVIFMIIVTWDLSILKGDRFFHEGTYTVLRIIFVFSFLLSFFMRIKVDFKFK